ncbi:MAG: hypothetical protein ACRC7R_09105 [Sarcina sp.]
MAFIKVLNKSSLRIDFWVYYKQKTQVIRFAVHSPIFGNGEYERLYIPDDSTKIEVKVFVEKSAGSFSQAFSKSFNSVSDKCYELLGSKKSLKFNEVACSSGAREDFVYFQNQANATMKCELIYTVGKEGFKSEGPPISKKNDGMAFSMPKEAEFIQFKIFYLEKDNSWTAVQNFVFKERPVRKCYISKDNPSKKPPVSIIEVKCPNLSSILLKVGVINEDNSFIPEPPIFNSPISPNFCNCNN